MDIEVKKKQIQKQCYLYALNFYTGYYIETLARKISPRYYTKHCNVYIITEYQDFKFQTAITFGGYGNNFGVTVSEKLIKKFNEKASKILQKNTITRKMAYSFFGEFISEIENEIEEKIKCTKK